MILFENIFIALTSLKSNPLRSILTLIGIAVGIAAVLYVVTLGEITQQKVKQQLESLGSNVLTIQPGDFIAGLHQRPINGAKADLSL